jgi:hypothetical protein
MGQAIEADGERRPARGPSGLRASEQAASRPRGAISPLRALNPELARRKLSLFLLVVPGILLTFVFDYIPMAGLQLAFREFTFAGGIWRSPFVGLANFAFLRTPDFWPTSSAGASSPTTWCCAACAC